MIELTFTGDKTQISTLELFDLIESIQNNYAHIHYANDYNREQLVRLSMANLEPILSKLFKQLERLNLSEGKNV